MDASLLYCAYISKDIIGECAMNDEVPNVEDGNGHETIEFILGDTKFKLKNIDASMNKALIRLYTAFLGCHPYNGVDFQQASLDFFDRAVTNSIAQDKYFTNFTIIWRHLFNNGRLNEAESLWELAVGLALSWEGHHKGQFIHKGTPFYFWGTTSLVKGDLDRGFVLIHQALKEDIRTSKTIAPDTPAFLFASLNYENPKQYLREWVQEHAKFLSGIIASYNCSRNRKFSIDDFRNRFLSKPPNLDAVFLFVYSLARIRNIELVPIYALSSEFAAQLEINLLFDVALVIDDTIKGKNSNGKKFIEHAEFLSNSATLGLTQDKLGQINGQFNINFEKTLSCILDGSFQFNDGSKLVTPAACDLAIVYGLRNYAAHNVSAASTVWECFNDIRQSLFNVLFLTVETLY